MCTRTGVRTQISRGVRLRTKHTRDHISTKHTPSEVDNLTPSIVDHIYTTGEMVDETPIPSNVAVLHSHQTWAAICILWQKNTVLSGLLQLEKAKEIPEYVPKPIQNLSKVDMSTSEGRIQALTPRLCIHRIHAFPIVSSAPTASNPWRWYLCEDFPAYVDEDRFSVEDPKLLFLFLFWSSWFWFRQLNDWLETSW